MSEKSLIYDQIERFSHHLGEPQELLDKRLEALKLIDQLDYPKIERASYRDHLNLSNHVDLFQKGQEQTQLLEVEDQSHSYMRLLHDQVLDCYISDELQEAGVIFATYQEVLQTHPDIILDYYMTSAIPVDQDKVSAHHAAFMNAGVVLYLPENTKLDEAVQLNVIQDATVDQPFNLHVLIVLEKASSLTFIEKTTTEGNVETTANIAVEVIAKEDAYLNYSAIDQKGEQTQSYVKRYANAYRGAKIDWAIGLMDQGHVVMESLTNLHGDGSHMDFRLVSISTKDQHQVVNSAVNNRARNTFSNILQHGVILDQSNTLFNAVSYVESGAKGSNVDQESRLLMFSQGSRGDANPILLIDEFDITAGHAVSVGQIDREHLYYLMSRGIKREQALKLSIRGFLSPVLESVPLQMTRDELVDKINEKLESL